MPGFSAENTQYVQRRISELAQGHCLASYKWDGGGVGWNPSMAMDSELLVHVIATFFDVLLAPPIAPAAASVPSSTPGSMFSATSMPGPFGAGLGTSSMFGCTAGAAGAPKPLAKSGVFWRTPSGLGFSAYHLAKASDKQRVRSDVVVLHQHHIFSNRSTQLSSLPFETTTSGSVDGVGGANRPPPRYSLMCDGAEWVVTQGEHNAWDTMVLFFLQRAKRGGALGALDLSREVFSSFTKAITDEGAAQCSRPETVVVGHGPLSILQPWCQALEDLVLDDVTERILKN